MWEELESRSKSEKPIHVLMRFSDKLRWRGDTIAEHQTVIDRHGAVWLGKLGKPLAKEHIGKITAQRDKGVPSYLYLVQNTRGNYQAYRGTIVEITRTLPEEEEYLVPAYYKKQDIMSQVGFWTKLSEIVRLGEGDLGQLHVATSGSAVPFSLATSIAALFVVRAGRGTGGY